MIEILASYTCSMPRQDFSVPFVQSHKILSKIFRALRFFKTQREKLCNDDVNIYFASVLL